MTDLAGKRHPISAALLLAVLLFSAGPSQATTPAPASSQNTRVQAADVVLTAMAFLDLPYAPSGQSLAEGFDCSGFTRHVLRNSLGIWLPRRAEEQANDPAWLPVEQHQLQPGDLVFFNTMRRNFSHVGIYAGNGRFIHAPKPGSAIRLEDMRKSYWVQRFDGGRRAASLAGDSAVSADTGTASTQSPALRAPITPIPANGPQAENMP